jgi:hypothetical protein
MWQQEDLRSALRVLERETPDPQAILSRVLSEGARPPEAHRKIRRPRRRLIPAAAAAFGVVAIAVTSLILTGLPGSPHRPTPPRPEAGALRSLPPYYLIISRGSGGPGRAVIRSSLTGRLIADVPPPAPYTGWAAVSAAADDRTFLLFAYTTPDGTTASPYLVRLDAATGKLTINRAPGLAASYSAGQLAGAALSPDGSKVAVATETRNAAIIRVFSARTGAVLATWTAPGSWDNPFGPGVGNLQWAGDNALAFRWTPASGSVSGQAGGMVQGARMLDIGQPGRNLLAASTLFCIPPMPLQGFDVEAYFAPNGTRYLAMVTSPVAIGDRPACSPAVEATSHLKLEEFSTATDRALGLVRQPDGIFGGFWSNRSGSVLVTYGSRGPRVGRRTWPLVGVLSKGVFTPLPGARRAGLVSGLGL